MSTDHTVRRLTAEEIAKHAAVLGWDVCTVHKCQHAHAYMTSHIDNLGKRVRRRVCAVHAQRYATRHGITMPPLPQQPKDHVSPLPASVIARGADNSCHGSRTS